MWNIGGCYQGKCRYSHQLLKDGKRGREILLAEDKEQMRVRYREKLCYKMSIFISGFLFIMLTDPILFLLFNDWYQYIVAAVSDLLQSDWICFRIIFFQSIKSYIEFLFGMILLKPDQTEEMASWILLTVLEYSDLHMRRELKMLLMVNTVIIMSPNIPCQSYLAPYLSIQSITDSIRVK